MNLKKIVAEFAEVDESKILVSPKSEMGDFCLPCFDLAKQQKCSPNIIAENLKKQLFNKPNFFIDKLEVMGGYLNFFINRSMFAKTYLGKNEHFNFEYAKAGENQTVCVEYGSPNLAKYLHIGHLSTLMIGESLARIYEKLGFNTIRINYPGDYGTPFGKMVVAIKMWCDDVEKLKQSGIDGIQDLYVKFAQNETPELLEMARTASKKIEDKQGEEYELYKMIIDASLKEVTRVTDLLGIKYNLVRGESYYNNQLQAKVNQLIDANLAKKSQGAQIVDLENDGLGIAVVQRSDEGSVYITRDLCTVEDRYDLFNFDKMLYVVAVEQKLHFQQLFKICEKLGRPFASKLEHISYGLVSTPEGKISSRKGKQALFVDIFDTTLQKAKDVIKDKTFEIENKDKVAEKVALGAMALTALKTERVKDSVFDIDKSLSFDGETAPYLQYTYARTCSLIRKFEALSPKEDFVCDDEFDKIFESHFDLIKQMASFDEVVLEAQKTNEPCIITRALFALAKSFNQFYGDCKIIDEEHYERTKTLIKLVKLLNEILAFAMPLVLIEPIQEM